MLRYLFDTDHLTHYQHGHPLVIHRVGLRPRATVGISVVTVEEMLRGRMARVAQARDGRARIGHYQFLEETLQLFAQFPVVSYDQAVEDEFQRIRHIRIGTQDLKIAATALAHRLPLVTANRRDFAQVPGLVIEDWSV
jgi:tRNA(fMet)-specific endonuclease VapC